MHQTNITPQVSNYRTLTAGEYVSFNLTHNDGEKHPYHLAEIVNISGSNKKGGRPNNKSFKKSNRKFKEKLKAKSSNKQRNRRKAA